MAVEKQLADEDPGKQVVIFGTSSFGELVYYFFTNDSPYRVVGFTAEREYVDEEEKFGLPVVPFEELEREFEPGECALFIAVAYSRVNQVRKEFFEEAKSRGYELVSYIHSSATVADNVEIGENTFIFEDQTIQPYVDIGDNVVLWSGNHIGHHSTVSDHCFIASHVVVSGHCVIEEASFLGVNATLANGLTIGARSIVGAGAVIVEDTQSDGVYVGEPARLHSEDSSESEI